MNRGAKYSKAKKSQNPHIAKVGADPQKATERTAIALCRRTRTDGQQNAYPQAANRIWGVMNHG